MQDTKATKQTRRQQAPSDTNETFDQTAVYIARRANVKVLREDNRVAPSQPGGRQKKKPRRHVHQHWLTTYGSDGGWDGSHPGVGVTSSAAEDIDIYGIIIISLAYLLVYAFRVTLHYPYARRRALLRDLRARAVVRHARAPARHGLCDRP